MGGYALDGVPGGVRARGDGKRDGSYAAAVAEGVELLDVRKDLFGGMSVREVIGADHDDGHRVLLEAEVCEDPAVPLQVLQHRVRPGTTDSDLIHGYPEGLCEGLTVGGAWFPGDHPSRQTIAAAQHTGNCHRRGHSEKK